MGPLAWAALGSLAVARAGLLPGGWEAGRAVQRCACVHVFSPDGCSPLVYRVLEDPRRSPLASLAPGQDPLCDDLLPPGWYRLTLHSRPAVLPSACPAAGQCGTLAPVWLEAGPALAPGTTRRAAACVAWTLPGAHHCCLFTVPIGVRQCDGFVSYFLTPTQACSAAYCTADTPPSAGGLANEDRDMTGADGGSPLGTAIHTKAPRPPGEEEEGPGAVGLEVVRLEGAGVVFNCSSGRGGAVTWLAAAGERGERRILHSGPLLPLTGIRLGETVACEVGAASPVQCSAVQCSAVQCSALWVIIGVWRTGICRPHPGRDSTELINSSPSST
jgi:hypothetical protein